MRPKPALTELTGEIGINSQFSSLGKKQSISREKDGKRPLPAGMPGEAMQKLNWNK